MSEALSAWLATRQPPPPPGLARALADALADAPGPLSTAALAALRRAIALGDARPAAWELLAADGLLTYAFEHAAEAGPAALDALLETLSPAAVAEAALSPESSGGHPLERGS